MEPEAEAPRCRKSQEDWAMPALLPAVLLGSHLVLAAEKVPELNIEPSCQAAAATAVMPGRDAKSCLQDEHNARDKLEKEWGEFNAAERSHCLQLSHTGGSPSYVELLTCLEMAQAARQLPPAGKLKGR
jgi:hypothetical protein